ncbi:MAG: hypothetical protein JSW62_01885 [Thermoplasmatales archaeon]|nr:MAG: hypothetical protein JSW62_01885 [Thermoplasmatales archaeon]
MITSGEGKYKVWLEEKKIENDLIYILGGGEKSHIGGIVVCEPNKKTQAISFEKHYDHVVLQPIAEAACKKYNTNVVAVGGIHINNASKEEIDIVVKNCKELIKYI